MKAKHWFESLEVITEPTSRQRDALLKLVGDEGLATLFGLLLGERQGLYVMLSALDLSDPAQVRVASVTQGKIHGIERIQGTVLDLIAQTAPTEEGDHK